MEIAADFSQYAVGGRHSLGLEKTGKRYIKGPSNLCINKICVPVAQRPLKKSGEKARKKTYF